MKENPVSSNLFGIRRTNQGKIISQSSNVKLHNTYRYSEIQRVKFERKKALIHTLVRKQIFIHLSK